MIDWISALKTQFTLSWPFLFDLIKLESESYFWFDRRGLIKEADWRTKLIKEWKNLMKENFKEIKEIKKKIAATWNFQLASAKKNVNSGKQFKRA